MVEYNIPRMTIFNDDITSSIAKHELENQLVHLFSVIPRDWDLVFLECGDNCQNMTRISDNIYITKNPGCTYSYMISLKCAQILIKKPIYSGPDTNMRNFIENNTIKAYVIQPGIFTQKSKTLSNFSKS